MTDRSFDRLFNEAQAKERAVEEAYLATLPTIHTEADDENILRRASAPMTAADGIARILLAWKDKDYFRLLQLDRPEADALGRPVWAGTDADVSRAYRRISILVHPDKFRGDDSRQEQILAKEAEAARERRRKREAEATLQERLIMNSQHKEAKTALIEDEGKAFAAMMKRQRDDRLDAMKRKKTRANKVGDSGSDGESCDDEVAAAVAAAAEQEILAAAARLQAQEECDEADAASRRRANVAKRKDRQKKRIIPK